MIEDVIEDDFSERSTNNPPEPAPRPQRRFDNGIDRTIDPDRNNHDVWPSGIV